MGCAATFQVAARFAPSNAMTNAAFPPAHKVCDKPTAVLADARVLHGQVSSGGAPTVLIVSCRPQKEPQCYTHGGDPQAFLLHQPASQGQTE